MFGNDRSEDKARACYMKAIALRDAGNDKDAIAALQALSERGVFWGAEFVRGLDLLAELCLRQEEDMVVDRLFPAFRFTKTKLRGSQFVETGNEQLVAIMLKHSRAMAERMRSNMARVAEQPSEEDVVLAALSGVSPAVRARERYCFPVERAITTVLSELLNFRTIGTTKKLFPIYMDAARRSIQLCLKADLSQALGRTADAIVRTINKLVVSPIETRAPRNGQDYWAEVHKALEVDRRDLLSNPPMCGDLIDLLCFVLRTLTEESCWFHAWMVLQCLKKTTEVIFSEAGLRELKLRAYAAMAEAFWTCREFHFHAYCLLVVTWVDAKRAHASRAVLAALCAPDAADERSCFDVSRGAAVERQYKLGELFEHPPSSRGEVLQRLQAGGMLAAAHPNVAKLAALLTDPATNTAAYKQAMTLLDDVAREDPALDMYRSELRQVVARKHLEHLASTASRVPVADVVLDSSSAALTPSRYVTEVEPFLLQHTVVQVEIDHRDGTVAFRGAARDKVLAIFTKLAYAADTRPAKPATTTASSPRKPAAVRFADIEAAETRSRCIFRLQGEYQQCATERIQKRIDEKEQARLAEIERRKVEEQRKREAAQERSNRRLLAAFRDLQQAERRRLVLQKLRAKYPDISLDNSLAQKNPSEFVEVLTKLVADYKRKKLNMERRDVMRMNVFERALRSVEVPARAAMEVQMAEKHKADREEARQNFLLQHRKEYDRRIQERETLQKYLAEAAVFEEQTNRLKEKASKRDEQQRLLEMEIERLKNAQ